MEKILPVFQAEGTECANAQRWEIGDQCAYSRVGDVRSHKEAWIERSLNLKDLEGHEKNI